MDDHINILRQKKKLINKLKYKYFNIYISIVEHSYTKLTHLYFKIMNTLTKILIP